MTDDLDRDLPGPESNEIDRGADAPMDPDRADEPTEQSPWLKEGADAPDAADIEEPDTQR